MSETTPKAEKIGKAEKERRHGVLRSQAANMIGLVQQAREMRSLFLREPWLAEIQPESFKKLMPQGHEATSLEMYQCQQDWLALIPSVNPKNER